MSRDAEYALRRVLDARFSGRDAAIELHDADLRGSELCRGDLDDAILEGCRFDHASLAGAKLRRARLGGSSFVDADLSGADLTQADLRGANLEGAALEGATLAEADLRGALVTGALGQPVSIAGARLDAAACERSGLSDEQVIELWRQGVELMELAAFSPAVQTACGPEEPVAAGGVPSLRGLGLLEVELRRQLGERNSARGRPSAHRLAEIVSSSFPPESDPPAPSLPPPSRRLRKLSGQFSSLIAPDEDELPPPPSEPPSRSLHPADSIIPGARLLGVRLEERIGEGHLGVVWKGRDRDGKLVAVKAFDRSKLEVGLSVAAFRRGVETMLRLSGPEARHRHLIEVLRAADNRLAIVMPHAENGSLVDFSALGWSARKTVAMFRKIAAAVAHAHQEGVLHLGLKPSNILLDGSLEPWVSDFQMVDFVALVERASDPGGLGRYAAPEEVMGYGTQSPTADVYSLGRLLWFMLLGRDPDEPSTRVPSLAALSGQPEGLIRIIRKCTLPDASQRYQEVEALLEDLERYESGQVGLAASEPSMVSIRPGRVSALRQPKPWLARHDEALPKPPPAARGLSRRAELAIGGVGALLIALALLRLGAAALPDAGLVSQTQITLALGAALLAFLLPLANARRLRFAFVMIFGATMLLIDLRPLAVFRLERTLSAGSPHASAEAVRRLTRLGHREFVSAPLSGVDLTGADLGAARFDGAVLTGAILRNAALMESSFAGANLEDADLRGADLTLAEIEGAHGLTSARCDGDTNLPPRWRCDEGRFSADAAPPPPPDPGGASILTQ